MVTLSLRCTVFEIFDFKMPWPWKPGLGSVKVTENVVIRQSAYDFLLTFHSNQGPISYRFRDRRRFQSKIARFSHPLLFCAPAEGVPLGFWQRRRESKKLEWWSHRADKEVWRQLQLCLGHRMHQRDRQTDRQTDRRTDGHPATAWTALTPSVVR